MVVKIRRKLSKRPLFLSLRFSIHCLLTIFYWILNGSCVLYYAKALHNELFDFFEKYWTSSEIHGKRLIQRSKLKTKRIVQIRNRHKFILKKWDYRSWLKSLHKTKRPRFECKWNFTKWAEVFFFCSVAGSNHLSSKNAIGLQ